MSKQTARHQPAALLTSRQVRAACVLQGRCASRPIPCTEPRPKKAGNMIVESLMTRNPASIRPERALSLAAQLMWDRDCGALPVVDESGKVIGMITDRDICMATWSQGRAPSAIFVAEVMSPDVVCCGPGDTISRAESIMRANQLRRLPVADPQGQLVGILSLADIARAAHVKLKLGSDPGIAVDGLVATLAEICASPPPSVPRARPGSML
jgi:CBS domain-containing protein